MVDTSSISNDSTLSATEKTLTIAAAQYDDAITTAAILSDAKADALTADMIFARMKADGVVGSDADLMAAAIRWWIF
jgi:hypothetical protein